MVVSGVLLVGVIPFAAFVSNWENESFMDATDARMYLKCKRVAGVFKLVI
jgi:hypothetical protein